MATTDYLVAPLLPTCLDGSLTQADFNPDLAATYDPSSWSYYKKVLPSTIPGIVLGCLSLVALIFFLIWIIVQYCACCARCCSRHRDDDADSKAQFIKEEGSYGAAAFGIPQKKRYHTCTRVMQILIAALALATTGVAAWGLAASIKDTDSQITDFWALVDSVDGKVNSTTTLLNNLSNQISTLQASVNTLNSQSSAVQQLVSALGPTGTTINDALNAVNQAQSSLGSIQQSIDDATGIVNDTVGTGIHDMKGSYEQPSLTFEDTGRFVAIAVVFGLTILASLLAGGLSLRVRHPIWASVWVAILWLFVAILMLLGVGLLKGVYVVGKDTCLYAETFVTRYANTKVTDPTKKAFLNRALTFYFNQNLPLQQPQGTAISAVTGIDLQPVYNLLQSPAVASAAQLLNSSAGALLATQSGPMVEAIQNITGLLQPANATVYALDQEISRASVEPIYNQGKSFICCDLSSSANDIFVAWTVTGALGFALAALCGWRIVRHTFGRGRR